MKICIDAGHYGNYNRSPGVKSYYESKQMWKLHLLLEKELEAYGVEVITTRAEQTKDLALEKPYFQVFSRKHGFQSDLSIMDLLFNEGPDSILYLKTICR